MKDPAYIRSFVFGVEDSLVATVGLVSGVAAAGGSQSAILLAGIVLTFVEAFSMAVGSLLSDNSAREFEHKGSVPMAASLGSAVVMFISYFISGFIGIGPYLFLPPRIAFVVSIVLSLLALFILGVVSARLSHTSKARKGLFMMVVGGAAIAIGIVVGIFAHRAGW